MTKQLLPISILAIAMAISFNARAEDFFNQLDQIVQNVTPRKNARWGVSKLSLNTSKTHGGMLGLMPFKGTVTSTLSWIPKNASAQSVDSKATDIKSFALDNGQEAATAWYREFLKAKKLNLDPNNEMEFLNLFLKARAVAQQIASVDHPDWSIDQFVVERGLTVKGVIAPLTSAEAQYAIRFSYDLKSAKKATAVNPELTNLVLGLAEDLSTSAKQFSLATWDVDGFNLGLGMSASLGFGVVTAKPHAFAYMKFKAKQTKGIMTSAIRRKINQATATGIKLFDYSSNEKLSAKASEKYFIIDRVKFRKGLAAALKMAKNMTVKAEQPDSEKKSWRLGQIMYRYEMGAGGNLSLVSLSGKVGAEVVLNKQLTPVKNSSSFNMTDAASANQDLKRTFATELQDNYQVLSATPLTEAVTGIESIAFLRINWGLETDIVNLTISAIPQIRLKFSK